MVAYNGEPTHISMASLSAVKIFGTPGTEKFRILRLASTSDDLDIVETNSEINLIIKEILGKRTKDYTNRRS